MLDVTVPSPARCLQGDASQPLQIVADRLIARIGIEQLGKLLARDGRSQQALIDGLEHTQHVFARRRLEIREDAAIGLHHRRALTRVTEASFILEQLAEAILEVEFRCPAETLGIGHRDTVAGIDLVEQERVGRVDDEAAKHARHRE